MKDSKYKGQLDRCEVELAIAPLRDKEPTPTWRKQFREMLRYYGVTLRSLMHLTATSNKVNMLGRRYGEQSLQALLAHYNDGHNDWTKNGFRTINDHLDILVDYLSKPEEEPKTLLQRLEESGRKPVHPKANHIDADEPHPGESWADYGNRLAQQVDDAKKTIAESGAKLYENIITLVSKKPVKVKLTRVHIIRR